MEDIASRQEKAAQEERVDYERVDDELIQDARNRRKRTRKEVDPSIRKIANDQEEDDDDFRMDIGKADKKFRVKRKKKHLFNDAGIKIEPFRMSDRAVEKHGDMLILNENVRDSDEEDDPWYESIRQQQEDMLKQKAREQVDSEESESSDEDVKSGDLKDDEIDFPTAPKANINEVIELKKKLLTFLQPKENVKKALKRLKPDPSTSSFQRIQTKKKNVRKKQKVEEGDSFNANTDGNENNVNERQFNDLMEVVNNLFQLKYLDVYEDDREAIEFEINQDEILKQRERDKKLMEENGW